jgi:hypothetical protein
MTFLQQDVIDFPYHPVVISIVVNQVGWAAS